MQIVEGQDRKEDFRASLCTAHAYVWCGIEADEQLTN